MNPRAPLGAFWYVCGMADKKDRAAAKAERQARQAAQAKKNAEVLAALPPQQRMAANIVTALLLIGGVLLALFMLRGCSSPQAANTANLTPAQLLAVGDGRAKDDAEMAAAYARLDAACPENGEQVADIATNFKSLVNKETGRDFPIIFLMDKLADAQSAAGASSDCVHTGALLATVAGEW